MARQPRFILPGQPQHIIQRGNNRQLIFVEAQDYEFYLEKLMNAASEHECQIHAYVLMTNHVHLLVSPARIDCLGKMMQMLGRYYVHYFNYKYKRTGTLWEGRYKACLISSEQYLFTCMRYIELNPMRAGMVDDPIKYQWSSYHHNALGNADPLIEPHMEYCNLGKTSEDRQMAYQALFQIPLELKILDEVRHATNKCWTLGDSKFKKEVALQLDRRVEPSEKGGDRKSKKYLKTAKINPVYPTGSVSP